MNDLAKLLPGNSKRQLKMDLYKKSLEEMNGVLFISENNTLGLSWVGENFTEIVGYKFNRWNRLVEKGLKYIVHPDDIHIFNERYDYFMNPATQDKSHSAIYRLRHQHGRYIFVYINAYVISRNPDGTPQKTGGLMINLKELMDPSFFEKHLHTRKNEENEEQIDLLSERELEILSYVSKGLTVPRVAEILNLSKRTIESHKKNMQKKLGLANSVALISFAIGAGI